MELKDKVTCIKGIGEKTAGNLAKAWYLYSE